MKSRGMTIIELMVSMALMSIIIIVVFFIYLTASKAFIKWQSESSFTDTSRLVINSLDNSISNTIKILDASHSSIKLLEVDLKKSEYSISSAGRFLKNDLPLSSNEFQFLDLSFNYIISENDSMIVKHYEQLDSDNDFKVTDEELSNVEGLSYTFILSSKDNQKTFNGLVMMRNY